MLVGLLFVFCDCVQSCSLYLVAVQSKAHKGVFEIIFFIRRDLLNCLWNTCTYHIIFMYHIKQSIIVLIVSKTTCACFFEKVDAESLQPPPKFQVNIKIQLNTSRASRLSFRFLLLCHNLNAAIATVAIIRALLYFVFWVLLSDCRFS